MAARPTAVRMPKRAGRGRGAMLMRCEVVERDEKARGGGGASGRKQTQPQTQTHVEAGQRVRGPALLWSASTRCDAATHGRTDARSKRGAREERLR